MSHMDLSEKILKGIANIDIHLRPKEYSREVLKVICRDLGYYFGSIILVNEDGEGSMFASFNLPERYLSLVHGVTAPVLSSPSGTAIREGKIEVVNNIFSDIRLEPWWKLLDSLAVKTIVWVPLFSKGIAFGTYILYDLRRRKIKDDEKDILNRLSMLFSLAIKSNEYIDEVKEKSKELEAANRVKSEFLTTMSHELRTPMNAIMGFAEILLMDENDPEKRDALTTIRKAGESLLHLINGILEFSEIESGKIKLMIRKFSLAGLLENIYKRFNQIAAEKKILLEIEKDPSIPAQVRGDEIRISQVITNLVDNGIKFTKQGRVRVECSYRDNAAVFRISDTGIGIPMEKEDTIYAIFTQLNMTTTRDHEGIGLGLTVVKKLVDRMRGTITLESVPGGGSTFTVRLPLPEG